MKKRARPDFSCSNLREHALLADLLHKLGHEIGNPLTSIISLSSIIERVGDLRNSNALPPERLVDYAKAISDEAWRIQKHIERLVLLYSDRTGDQTGVDLARVLREVTSQLLKKHRAAEERVRISELTGEFPVSCDPDQLAILLRLILENALDATDDHVTTPVTIAISNDGNFIVLQITNQLQRAIPIPLEELFKPFVTTSPTNKKMGLGLTVAAAIVERFHGEIAIAQWEENGSYLFSTEIRLPRLELRKSSENVEQSLSCGGTLSVAIIEDEPNIASALEKIIRFGFKHLKSVDVEILTPEQFKFSLAAGHRPGVIICDQNLNYSKGDELFEFLSAKYPELASRFILCSGDTSFKEQKRIKFLAKPFVAEELIRLVNITAGLS